MNWIRLKLASLLVVFVTASGSMAGGFISHLPEDSVRVVYTVKFTSIETESDRKQQQLDDDTRLEFEIASVGAGPKYKGKPTRWIEMLTRMTRRGESRIHTFICLVPESSLSRDKYAVDAMIKGASRRGMEDEINLDTNSFNDVRVSPLPILLGIKPDSTKELPKKAIKHDGKDHQCSGLSTVIKQPERKATAQLDGFYSKDVPFGLVQGSIKLQIGTDKVTMDVKLSEVKRDAKPSIPIEEIVNEE